MTQKEFDAAIVAAKKEYLERLKHLQLQKDTARINESYAIGELKSKFRNFVIESRENVKELEKQIIYEDSESEKKECKSQIKALNYEIEKRKLENENKIDEVKREYLCKITRLENEIRELNQDFEEKKNELLTKLNKND